MTNEQTKWLLCEELIAVDGKIGCLSLNRPEVFNALNHAMIQQLSRQLQDWAQQTDIVAVVINSVEGRAFCAGGDIRALYDNRHQDVSASCQFFEDEYRLNYLIGTYPKPIIALVDGIVMGGGAGLAMHSSHRVGTENILFAMPEVGIGLHPDVGANYFLQQAPGLLAYYLVLTGARLGIADCCYAKLIDHFVPSNQLSELLHALCHTPLPGDAWQAVSEVIQQFTVEPDEAPLKAHQFVIDGVFATDSVEQIIHFLANDDLPWAKVVAGHIQQKSPMSLAVTFEAFQRAKGLSLKACLQQDFIVGQSFLKSHDLYEGIRAVLIDKDMQPTWQPASLTDVNERDVQAYFSPEHKKTLTL